MPSFSTSTPMEQEERPCEKKCRKGWTGGLNTARLSLWHSPPRPVLEPAIKANKEKIALQFSKIIKATADGNADAMERAITSTGITAQNACRSWFKDPRNGWPRNDPKTVKLKGSDKPLVDSGELRDSIVYVVREE